MPVIGTKAAASAQGFGFALLQGSGPAQWMAKLSGTYPAESAAPIVKADGSIYTFHAFPYNDPDSGIDFAACTVVLYNSSGALVASNTYRFASEYALSTSSVVGAVLNSDGTITIAGSYTVSVQQGYVITVASDLSTSNVRQFVGASGNNFAINSIASNNSSTNVVGCKYGGGNGVPTLAFPTIAANISSSQLRIGNPDGTSSTSDVFCAGDTTYGTYGAFSSETNPAKLKVAKFTAAGDISFKKRYILATSQNLRPTGVALDRGVSDNLVIACNNSSAAVILKLNSDGTVAWAKNLNVTNGMVPAGIKIEGSYVYVTGYYTNIFYVGRLNLSDGTISYMNKITASPGAAGRGSGVTISGDNMYVVGGGPSILKVPKDGTQTGTYTTSSGNTYIYEAASFTVTTASIAVTDFTTSPSVSFTNSTTTVSAGGTGFSSALYLK